ncbi:hypothetical protein HYV12_03045 [Candidatus Dojkabacteria bacterium]|nr:hypothetical protein [Candidatus Dojkabacteria bacterium]
MKEDVLLNIFFAIIDKIPGAIELLYKFISPIRIEPAELEFKTNVWNEKLSFTVSNLGRRTIYEIYLLIPIENTAFDEIKIKTSEEEKTLNQENLRNISLNYSILLLHITAEGKNFVLLKIYGLDKQTSNKFTIKTKGRFKSKLSILQFQTKEQAVLSNAKEIAIQFQIPKKFRYKNIKLAGTSILLKRDN